MEKWVRRCSCTRFWWLKMKTWDIFLNKHKYIHMSNVKNNVNLQNHWILKFTVTLKIVQNNKTQKNRIGVF